MDVVGHDDVAETPIFLLATAGMRLLPERQRKELLHQICAYTRKATPFMLPDCDAQIQVIPGDAEGLYGWVAANYLLGGFDDAVKHDHGKGHHTYGFLDMGGASAQIAFAPNATEVEKHANDLKLLRLRAVDGTVSEHRVFVTTWLEFGVQQARHRYVERLMDSVATEETEYPDPCLPKGLMISIKGDMLTPDEVKSTKLHMVGTGEWAECLRSTFPLLGKDRPCTDEPCLLNGVHAPAIDFDVNHFVGVSEYWHTMHSLSADKHGDDEDKAYDWASYSQRVGAFCSQDWASITHDIKAYQYSKDLDESRAAEICFKASWVLNVLHDGIGIPRAGLDHMPGAEGASANGTKGMLEGAKEGVYTDAFQALNKIDGTELSWTLGRMLLYAASEVPPVMTNTLPVGFGSNSIGNGNGNTPIPSDWQFAGLRHDGLSLADSNATLTDNDGEFANSSWHDSLFDADAPRRVPGFLLFILILCVAAFLSCGKDRRSRLYAKLLSRLPHTGSRRHPFSTTSSLFTTSKHTGASASASTMSMSQSQRDHLLESGGLLEQGDGGDGFELGPLGPVGGLDGVMDDYPDSIHSSASSSGHSSLRAKTGRSSGWATPVPGLRTPKLGGGGVAEREEGEFFGGSGGGVRRTESWGRLSGLTGLGVGVGSGMGSDVAGRSRSRRASPTRFKD